MISAKPAVMVAMLALAGSAVAQEKDDEQRIAALIEQLKDERARGMASAELLEFGTRILPQMLHALTGAAEPAHAEPILAVLGQMRLSADDTISGLMGVYRTSNHSTRPAFIRTAANLTPYSRRSSDDLNQILRPVLGKDTWALLRLTSPELGAAILNERERLVFRIGIFAESAGRERLVRFLYSGRAYWQELSAEMLGQMGDKALPEIPDLQVFLSQDAHFEVEGWTSKDLMNLYFSSDGTLIARPPTSEIPYDIQVKGAVADAMEKIAPDDLTVLTIVESYRLLQERDLYLRLVAATRLGQYGQHAEQAASAVSSLVEVLKDPDDRVAEEAITALGVIGPAAKDAIPTLEKLAEHEDPQIAERAKAALRQVRGR